MLRSIEPRIASQLESRYLLLVIGLVLAVNSLRLFTKHRRGERAYHDGDARPVTRFDVILSGALSLAALATCAYEWWRAR